MCICDICTSKWEEVRAYSKLEVRVWQKPIQLSQELKTASQVPHFVWADALERSQADRYGPHIQSCTSTPREVQWIDAANRYPTLLETGKCSALPFPLKGTTDYAAVECASVKARMPITGLKALVELRKVVDAGEMSFCVLLKCEVSCEQLELGEFQQGCILQAQLIKLWCNS